MSVNFETSQDILCLEPKEEAKNRFEVKKIKNKFFSNCPSFVFFPLHPYISKSTNNFEK